MVGEGSSVPYGDADGGGSVTECTISSRQPFDLDYFQVFSTLCDILGEVYSKILSFLGPPTSNAQTQASFPGFTQSSNPALNLNSGNQTIQNDRRTGVGLSPMLVEVVLKIDGKLKVSDGRKWSSTCV